MLVVALTGGIGSGKSTVSKLFAEHGVPIIDADLIAREITEPGQPAYSIILEHFGPSILLGSEKINRSKLRDIIFSDEQKRLWLENLLHPIIRKEIEQRISKLSTPYCIAVIPLLLESTPYSFIDRILVVDTPEHIQIERVANRDKTAKSHIESVIKIQIAREKRLARADDIIVNDGQLADLIPQVESLHRKYSGAS